MKISVNPGKGELRVFTRNNNNRKFEITMISFFRLSLDEEATLGETQSSLRFKANK